MGIAFLELRRFNQEDWAPRVETEKTKREGIYRGALKVEQNTRI